MHTISRIALLCVLAAGCAYADPPRPPAAPGLGPVMPPVPPAPAELAPLSLDFQAAMSNSQLATYRYTQLAEQALALKKLCDTGFGPADICPKPGGSVRDPGLGLAQGELPVVVAITGSRVGLSAVLALSDGRRLSVHPGTRLPDGSSVASISGDDVRLARGAAADIVLPFAGGDTK